MHTDHMRLAVVQMSALSVQLLLTSWSQDAGAAVAGNSVHNEKQCCAAVLLHVSGLEAMARSCVELSSVCKVVRASESR